MKMHGGQENFHLVFSWQQLYTISFSDIILCYMSAICIAVDNVNIGKSKEAI